MSLTIFSAIILIGKYMEISDIMIAMSQIFSITLVIIFAPVDNINKPIKSIERKKRLKYYSIAAIFLLSALCYLLPQRFLTTAVISIAGAVIMMVFGRINNVRLKM